MSRLPVETFPALASVQFSESGSPCEANNDRPSLCSWCIGTCLASSHKRSLEVIEIGKGIRARKVLAVSLQRVHCYLPKVDERRRASEAPDQSDSEPRLLQQLHTVNADHDRQTYLPHTTRKQRLV